MQEGADVHVSIGQTAQAQFDRAAEAMEAIAANSKLETQNSK